MTATQTLFNGFQTANRTRQAEQQVFSARETLRTTEQNTLLDAATPTGTCCRTEQELLSYGGQDPTGW
jgi:hypothetical protein